MLLRRTRAPGPVQGRLSMLQLHTLGRLEARSDGGSNVVRATR